jgi:uncharacterized membrane protein YqiK
MLGPLIVFLVVAILVLWLVVFISGVRFVPNNRIGIVEKRFSGKGSLKAGFIAQSGEAGYQPQVLRGGLHFLRPLQFRVHYAPLVTIPQEQIGYIFARDGEDLKPGQALASNAVAINFQDVTTFLKTGGQRGPQRQLLRAGTYAINLAQFVVLTEQRIYALTLGKEDEEIINRMATTIAERKGFRPVIIKDHDDLTGIVTVQDGPSLSEGEIIAPSVGDDPAEAASYHNKFQDADKFLAAGGLRGRQLQVLVEGTYYINRLFATVELVQKTTVEVGYAGVVVSYTGRRGEDLSGKDYRHGELVLRGHRGVWSEPLLPGKYAFNTYAGKVVMVPTTNIILKWSRAEVGAHGFDENLTEISLITKDAFEPNLPLAVVIHIDYREAPLVIQRFGDIKRLVEQTLDPMVGAYFKNIGQTRTLIQLIQDRSLIQQVASQEMQEKFNHYNLKLEEVLIGTPSSSPGDNKIEVILTQLRNRQIAEEQVETYARQEKAAVKERELREAESRAEQQRILTESEVSITIQSNEGKAQYQRALQQAAQIRALAEAEAEKAARIGIGQAIAIEEQVRAYGGPQYRVTQEVMNRFSEAVQQSGVDVVPRVVIKNGSDGGSGNGGAMEALMAMLLSERMGVPLLDSGEQRSPEVEAMRQQIRDAMLRERASDAASVAALPSTPPAPVPVFTLPVVENGESKPPESDDSGGGAS